MPPFGPKLRAFQALAAACLVLSCTTNPVSKKTELILLSTEKEEQIGREAAKQVEQFMGLVQSPELVEYVRAIGERLARVSPRQDVTYRFYVVDQPEPNAFAIPGGYIFVTRGLLTLTNSEAELANVIAHEIGHVAAHHYAQRQTRATGVNVLAVLAQIAAMAVASGETAQALSQLSQAAGAGYIASYSRDQEREADRVGQAMTARAGWDPAAMSSFLRTLERESELQHGRRLPGFLDSHPSTRERVSTTAGQARGLPRGAALEIAPGRAAFLSRIEGLPIGIDPAQGLFRGPDFLHPDLDIMLSFPEGWQVQNAPSMVGAIRRDGSAMVKLEMQSLGADPREAALAWIGAQQAMVFQKGPRSVSGLPAYRASVSGSTGSAALRVELTWIAHDQRIYRIACAVPARRYETFLPICDQTAKSFRPLSEAERDSIRLVTLRVAKARAGESLEQLGKRTGNEWNAFETAAMNGLPDFGRLGAGERVKIAVDQPYRSVQERTPPGEDADPRLRKPYPPDSSPAPPEGSAAWMGSRPSAAPRPSACCS